MRSAELETYRNEKIGALSASPLLLIGSGKWFCARREHVSALLEGVQAKDVTALVCAPTSLMEFATDALLAAGVPANLIRYERFDYAAGKGRLDRAGRKEALLPFLALLAAEIAFGFR
jgi:ferredoxin-NADP reductase